MEATVHGYLAHLAKIPKEEANALLSGARIMTAVGFIKRLHDARGISLDPAYEAVVEQLGLINGTRDAIVHYGAKFQDGLPSVVSTERTAHIPKKVTIYPISVERLDAMTADLDEIKRGVLAAMYRGTVEDEVFHMMFGEARPGAWQYKYPEPKGGSGSGPAGRR